MDTLMREKIRPIHRVNRLLWLSIVAGVLVLNVIFVVFDYYQMISGAYLQNVRFYINGLFALVLILLYLVLYVKRTYLMPEKLIARAQTHDLNITTQDVLDFIHTFGEKYGLLAKALIIMRRYYMVIWSMANLIVMLGFIQYIITMRPELFYIYSVVGVFSLAVNFPRFSIIETIYAKLESTDTED